MEARRDFDVDVLDCRPGNNRYVVKTQIGRGRLVHYEHLLESDRWKAMPGYANGGNSFGLIDSCGLVNEGVHGIILNLGQTLHNASEIP